MIATRFWRASSLAAAVTMMVLVQLGCDAPTAAPNTEGPVAGESQPADVAASDPVDSSRPGTAPAPQQPAPAPPQASLEEELRELQRLAGSRPAAAVEKARKLAQDYADNVDVAALAMAVTQNFGISSVQQGDASRAYPLFAESGQFAEKLLELTNGRPPEMVANMMGTVFYNQACAHGLEGEAEKAMAALNRALDNGFSDLDLLKTDADLNSVRDKPEFEELLAAALRKIEEAVARQYEEFSSFDFSFADLAPVQGETPVSLKDYQGKVVVVDFWGTWCPPCRAEIPHFVELQEKYREQGLQIVGLNYEQGGSPEEQKEKIRKFMEENAMNYPCALGDEATTDQVPGFNAFPTTLFIDRSGKVRLMVVGQRPAEELEAMMVKLLQEPAA